MSNILLEGQRAPSFELMNSNGSLINLDNLHGNKVVLYFYPKDNTPGCTLEGQNFRDNIDFFTEHNTIIFGISRDSLRMHENFKTKQSFPFDLLSDSEEEACRLFDVIKLKKLYGKEHMGIVRSTFLIDENGVLQQEWRNVKVKQHLDEVKDAISNL